jgi:hypothetical protein
MKVRLPAEKKQAPLLARIAANAYSSCRRDRPPGFWLNCLSPFSNLHQPTRRRPILRRQD